MASYTLESCRYILIGIVAGSFVAVKNRKTFVAINIISDTTSAPQFYMSDIAMLIIKISRMFMMTKVEKEDQRLRPNIIFPPQKNCCLPYQ